MWGWLKPLIEAIAPIFRVILDVLVEQIEKPQPAAKVDEGLGPAGDMDSSPLAYDPNAETNKCHAPSL